MKDVWIGIKKALDRLPEDVIVEVSLVKVVSKNKLMLSVHPDTWKTMCGEEKVVPFHKESDAEISKEVMGSEAVQNTIEKKEEGWFDGKEKKDHQLRQQHIVEG